MEVKNSVKFGSYKKEDVQFLLKDLSNLQLEGSTVDREKRIQNGQHYSETLPIEYNPPEHYLQLFSNALNEYKQKVAQCTAIVAEQIYQKTGNQTVLVSLARAGTPIGILIKRYIKMQYGVNLPHYSISIIRGKGIDENALLYILQKHKDCRIQFIDGWTGKGAISNELTKACQHFNKKYGVMLDDTLAVLADPGYCTSLFGTREDFLIPSACLNSTVSGLISRTVLNDAYIGKEDFHGAKFYQELLPFDVSNDYLEEITAEFNGLNQEEITEATIKNSEGQEITFKGMEEVFTIKEEFQIDSIHYVKPGVGETTRVLLRRVPWKILIKDPNSPYVRHIVMLAKEKGVEIIPYQHMSYTCCGLIKKVGKSG
ncbi:cysteine protease StiP family protein [Niallia sp. 01092]|uniref:cysteine protease StiP family protein n=1 Tax=unclassified Niallia TaxID=2837522 RepID=UPI003FCEF642